MTAPLFAVVGDANPARTFSPAMKDPAKASKAAEELGTELAKRGARLLVYGGPFIESDVVRGYVAGAPKEDKSILMWYTKDKEPPPFPEEQSHPKLFDRRAQSGSDWEIAFYRSIAHADGLILIGGGNATNITGQVAIGAHMPILALSDFGGAAATVWSTLSAGEDLPSRDDINLMALSWSQQSPAALIDSLFSQLVRRRDVQGTPSPALSILAGILFVAAVAIVPLIWGRNSAAAWMLFLAPLLAGGAGSAIRPIVDRLRGTQGASPAVLATVVLGVIAGGISCVLFVTAQLSGNPNAANELLLYAQRSVPFAVAVGFVAGLTSDAVFGKLLGLDIVRSTGVDAKNPAR
jgi:hypothetical protein